MRCAAQDSWLQSAHTHPPSSLAPTLRSVALCSELLLDPTSTGVLSLASKRTRVLFDVTVGVLSLTVTASPCRQGLRARHPIFIIPGFTTTGLEVWEGNPCAKRYFRQRMWGTLTMARTFLANRDCWFQHLKLG